MIQAPPNRQLPAQERASGARSTPALLGLCLAWLLGPAPLAADSVPTNEPPPAVPVLLQRLLARSKQDAEERPLFLERHAYTQNRVREERSPTGHLRSRSEEDQPHPPIVPSETPRDAGPGRRGYRERDFSLNQELLDRFEFTFAGRETLDDRTLCRLEFHPQSDELPVKKTADRFINRIAGTLWITEADGALVRAQLRLLDKVSFVGGLAGAVYSLNCTLERAATHEGLWYTRSSRWHVDFREFLVHKVVTVEEHLRDLRPRSDVDANGIAATLPHHAEGPAAPANPTPSHP